MTKDEALKLALAVLKSNDTWGSSIREAKEEAITAAEEALAQPQQEQEPVQFKCTVIDDAHPSGIPLEQWSKPQRTWVGLTDEQIEAIWRRVQANDFHDCVQPFARAIEAAHDIKENTWVGLTDGEVADFASGLWPLAEKLVSDRLRAIEAKLKEKNT